MSKSRKAKIKDLPNGVGVGENITGGRKYWQVRLGKKFTGGPIIRKKFDTLKEAREWIFGSEAAKLETSPGAIVDLKERAGGAAFGLSAAQINEAASAFRVLEGTKFTLTTAISYVVKHGIPVEGEKSVTAAIEKL